MNKLILSFITVASILGVVLAYASTVTRVDDNHFTVTDNINKSVTYTMNQINQYVNQSQMSMTATGKSAQTADETYYQWSAVQQTALNEIANANNT